MAQA
jgi:hypothetical protein